MLRVPVIDLFAGPGGLSEGFYRPVHPSLDFKIVLSIEKNDAAARTLLLRAFFRQFAIGGAPEEYYQYVRGDLSREG